MFANEIVNAKEQRHGCFVHGKVFRVAQPLDTELAT